MLTLIRQADFVAIEDIADFATSALTEAIEVDPDLAITDATAPRADDKEQVATDGAVELTIRASSSRTAMTIEDRTEQSTTDNTEGAQDGPEQTVTDIPDEVVEPDRRVSRLVALDEFDSEDFQARQALWSSKGG
ncbi:hypothetical protein GN244_ATG20453 [Phytophthora infestans]|uniref:Uncharacterized protein n=1 Tax=Phytophthora infestans TaxID=4787 RepID=A0A833SFF9_PHYIN|nr:hypothetical protein GN244_ATG20453 [Phytophthora infestans]